MSEITQKPCDVSMMDQPCDGKIKAGAGSTTETCDVKISAPNNGANSAADVKSEPCHDEADDGCPSAKKLKSETSTENAAPKDSANSNSGSAPEKEKLDPYAYLSRNDFTAEKYKLQIRGLPKHYGIGEFKKLMTDKLKLNPSKLKPPKKTHRHFSPPWMYVCFRSEEDRQKALVSLHKFEWKRKKLSAQLADACPDPLVKRRLEDEQNVNPPKIKLEFKSQEEALKYSVVPLWDVPYEKQLKDKEEKAKEVLKKINAQLQRENPDLADYLKEQNEKYDGLPCEFLGVVSAPDNIDGYRNKCEFTIGLDENKKKTVGFRLGTYAQGTKVVAPIPADVLNVPQRMKEAVWIFEKYVQNSSMDIYDPETHNGHWRMLTVRSGFAMDQLLLIIHMHPQNFSPEEVQTVKDDIVDFYTNREGKRCNPTSIYFQSFFQRHHGKILSPLEHIYGEQFILEKLRGLTFQISPQAFFQVNVAAAELLYKSVGDLAGVNKSTTLLDVCCGAGTIGLSLAQDAGQVLGLDISETSIQDANKNAERNNVSNCQFFSGAAETIISSVITRATFEDIVAVVDPPRPGLMSKAVSMLRRTEKINKLVYLSCNPSAISVIENFVSLCRRASKTLPNQPFIPVKAVAVDMFPHTHHYELVLFFKRLPPIENVENDTK